MDRDQTELKSIAFLGILVKTFNIIYKEKMIFAKIIPSFILPLTIILLGFPQFIVYIIVKKVEIIPLAVFHVLYVLFTLAGIMLALVFLLLPTSAIVYTIACIYTGKHLTFKTILRIVPKAWIRLMFTFAIQFLIMLAYHFVTILVLFPPVIWLTGRGLYSLIILAVLYFIGLVYISVIWSLANVVSLLEDLKGYGAVKKSKALLQGKRLLASSVLVLVYAPVVVVQIQYSIILYNDMRNYTGSYIGGINERRIRIKDAVRALITMVPIIHVFVPLGLVMQTIFYFVCKSYHHEIIDKSSLASHLDNLLPAAVYVPPVEKNVQLEHSDV